MVDFGRLILEAKRHNDPTLTYETLRAESASVANYSDAGMIDDQLLILTVLERVRPQKNVLIDSHAVTRERLSRRGAERHRPHLVALAIVDHNRGAPLPERYVLVIERGTPAYERMRFGHARPPG